MRRAEELGDDNTMNETLRTMWQTRPYRLPSSQGSSAPGAGVCEGIGIRYQVDPGIIRILFICSAFFGVGIVVYLLCWLCMPRYSMALAPAEVLFSKQDDPRYRGERKTGMILCLLLAVLVLGVGSLSYSGLPALLIAGLCWWLLHSKQPEPPAVTLATAAPVDGFYDMHNMTTIPGRTQPPSWDPLGTAPFAWDLPDPPPAQAAMPPKRRRMWPWLIIAGIIVAPVLFVSTMSTSDGVGEQIYTVTTSDGLEPHYAMDVGQLTLDLGNLEELPENKTVDITMGVGEILIILPDNVPVALNCNSEVGSHDCGPTTRNSGAKGSSLTLNVHNDIGSIEVQ